MRASFATAPGTRTCSRSDPPVARYHVYRNPRASRASVPFLLDVQTDFLKLETRLVIPLVKAEKFGARLARLHPTFTVLGQDVVLSTSDMAGLPTAELRQSVGDLSAQATVILTAIDFLLSGY